MIRERVIRETSIREGNVVYGGRVVGRVETVAARLGRTPVTREGIVRRALESVGKFKLKPERNTVMKSKMQGGSELSDSRGRRAEGSEARGVGGRTPRTKTGGKMGRRPPRYTSSSLLLSCASSVADCGGWSGARSGCAPWRVGSVVACWWRVAGVGR